MLRVGLVAVVVSLGCSGAESGGDASTGSCEHEDKPPQDDPGDEMAPAREDCMFRRGSMTSDSIGGTSTPQISHDLQHVIVILRENRSFDHYMGAYGPQFIPLTGDESNPDAHATPRNKPVPRFHEHHYCTPGPDHEWDAVHLQFNNGRLDGFVAASNRGPTNEGGCEAMGYYNRSDIPFYYWLADNFAMSENYHAAVLGPTLPNMMFYFYASSCGSTENIESEAYRWTGECKGHQSIFQLLDAAGVKNRVYGDANPTVVSAAVGLAGYSPLRIRDMSVFSADVANDTLDDVVFIEPNYGHAFGVQNDEHPPSNIQVGEDFVYGVINTLMTHAEVWKHTIVFITWDEHGGYYDHVKPPKACTPDRDMPYDFDFEQLGFRTPFFAVSPFAKKHYISHVTTEHSSILRFIEAWKGLGALTSRDANAWPLFDMFDFQNPHFDVPTPDASLAPIDPQGQLDCATPATTCVQ